MLCIFVDDLGVSCLSSAELKYKYTNRNHVKVESG